MIDRRTLRNMWSFIPKLKKKIEKLVHLVGFVIRKAIGVLIVTVDVTEVLAVTYHVKLSVRKPGCYGRLE
jgi:hypothetical protein